MTDERLRIDGHDHLSSAQVARHLGIKPETVYAYVSRGVLHRVRVPGRRESYFAVAEVEALTHGGRPTRRRGPGLTDDIRTAITLVEPDRLSYRGLDAVRLAEESDFASVARLLWQHDARFEVDVGSVAELQTTLATLPAHADTAVRLRTVLTGLGARDPWRRDLEPAHVAWATATVIATSVAVLGEPGPVDVPRQIARAGGLVGEGAEHWIDQAMILLADHDLAGSTTAVRVTASARADPYAALAAGVNAWDSPLHGTASRAAYRMLDDLLASRSGAGADRPPPGFGHLVYVDRDPRAEFLIGRLGELADHPVLELAERLADRVWQRFGVPRNVDLALALGAHALGGHADLGDLVFLHARMAGWAAHLIEEYASEPLRFRLRGVYTGPRH